MEKSRAHSFTKVCSWPLSIVSKLVRFLFWVGVDAMCTLM